MNIGIIGSTGLDIKYLCGNYIEKEIDVEGEIVKYVEGEAFENRIFFLVRNLMRGAIAPHAVDYLLIMKTMKTLKVDVILATSVVGSLRSEYEPGQYVIVDQFLDFTKHRAFTAFSGNRFAFVDFTYPYCSSLRMVLEKACQESDVIYHNKGCYVGVDGPRYETAAEVRAYSILGGDIIGMTNVPEVIIAREMGLCYSTVALIVNYGAGITGNPILRKDCYDETIKHVDKTGDILKRALMHIESRGQCDCKEKPSDLICDAK